MLAKILIAVGLLAPQTQTPDPDIALILGTSSENVTIMKRSQAEELYGRLEQVPDLIRPRIKAALEIALGTVPDSPSDFELELLTLQEAERFRWQREPLQGRKN